MEATSEYIQAVDLIKQAVDLLQSLPARSHEEAVLISGCTLIQQASGVIGSVPDAGKYGRVRQRIYELIQAQKSDGDCVFYKEMSCSIHFDLLGQNGVPVTLLCGHSYCKECIKPVINHANPAQRRCPQCNLPITIRVDQLGKSAIISNLLDKIIPRQVGGTRKSRKRKSNACTFKVYK